MRNLPYLLLLGLIACGESVAPVVQEAGPTVVAEVPPTDDGALVGITVKVQDYQVFHPFSRTRALLEHASPVTTNKRTRKGLTKAKDSFGTGLVVDATNASPHLLSAPDLLGEFVMEGVHGTVRCELDPKRTRRGQGTNHLSFDPTSKNPWRDESKQTYEKIWRPGEIIRLRVREDCGNFFVYDTDLQSVTTTFRVEARSMLSPGNPDLSFPLNSPDAPLVRSERTVLSLPPSSLMLQKVKLAEGWAYAAGDVIITWDGARVVRNTLGGLGLRADTLTRADLPESMEEASTSFDELLFRATTATLLHWSDAKNISKGQRRLEIEAELRLDTEAIKSRLSKDIDAASPQAEAAVAKGLAAETARLLALLPCNRISLVTTKRVVGLSNTGEAAGACAALSADGPAALRLRYRLGRYEVPVGLILSTRAAQHFVPIAHQALLRFDAR